VASRLPRWPNRLHERDFIFRFLGVVAAEQPAAGRIVPGDAPRAPFRAGNESPVPRAWPAVGTERQMDAAKKYGYKDGSAITQIIKHLQTRVAAGRSLRTQLANLQTAFTREMSCVKS
jgi:hypothetical protein